MASRDRQALAHKDRVVSEARLALQVNKDRVVIPAILEHRASVVYPVNAARRVTKANLARATTARGTTARH